MYNKHYAAIALAGLHEGISLSEVCREQKKLDPDFPNPTTIRHWYVDNQDAAADGFVAKYAQARRAQGQYWSEEILEIADEGRNDYMDRRRKDGSLSTKVDNECVQRSKLRIEARKWLLSKLHPDVYAERFIHQTLGADGKPVDPPSSMQIDLASAVKGWKPKAE